jgi:hypothetical protein
MTRDDVLLSDFAKAGERLAEALSQPETDVLRDACIQRFEFCFELAWKSVQAVGRAYGQECCPLAWRSGSQTLRERLDETR